MVDEAEEFRLQMTDDVVVGPIHGNPVRPVGMPLGVPGQFDVRDAAGIADGAVLRRAALLDELSTTTSTMPGGKSSQHRSGCRAPRAC